LQVHISRNAFSGGNKPPYSEMGKEERERMKEREREREETACH
jgi:hypothetical protein